MTFDIWKRSVPGDGMSELRIRGQTRRPVSPEAQCGLWSVNVTDGDIYGSVSLLDCISLKGNTSKFSVTTPKLIIFLQQYVLRCLQPSCFPRWSQCQLLWIVASIVQIILLHHFWWHWLYVCLPLSDPAIVFCMAAYPLGWVQFLF